MEDAAMTPSNRLEADIFFPLSENFYIGDIMNPAQVADAQHRTALVLPGFARAIPLMPSSQEIIGHEAELVQYYRQIIAQARALGRRFHDVREYFGVRLQVTTSETEVSLSFPWYDKLVSIKDFADALEQPEDVTLVTDAGQGWRIDSRLEDSYVTIRQDKASADTPVIVAERQNFVQQLRGCYQRASAIIVLLTEAFGYDLWSEYIEDDSFTL